MGLSFRASGSWKSTETYLNRLLAVDPQRLLAPFGAQGVAALQQATPIDSGIAAGSWYYEIKATKDEVTISWHNRDIETGFPVAIMLQYGYSTGTGGYVKGRDYINPAMRPIFDQISEEVRKVVTA